MSKGLKNPCVTAAASQRNIILPTVALVQMVLIWPFKMLSQGVWLISRGVGEVLQVYSMEQPFGIRFLLEYWKGNGKTSLICKDPLSL